MPGFDGTGPRGEGPFTGRGEGYCVMRFPKQGSHEPAVGLAGLQGVPVEMAQGYALQTSLAMPVMIPSMTTWPHLRLERRMGRCRGRCRRWLR